MKEQELIVKYLSVDQQYIIKIPASLPLNNKSDLFAILKWWKTLSKQNTISDLKGKSSNPEPWIHIKIGSKFYKIHADTTKEGVKEFINNKENQWTIIIGEKGNKNKVTNSKDKNPIKGLYMYVI